MSFTARFSDIEVNVQNIDGKPMLVEHILSDRTPKTIETDALHILKPVQTGISNISYGLFHSRGLQKFDPKIPKTQQDFTALLTVCISLVETIKTLHQSNLSIGLLSAGRFCVDERGNLVVLGNSLISEAPQSNPFANYTLEDLCYLAPECYENVPMTPDHRSDFYSLGITLYVWFTGSLPFKGNDKLELMHHHLTQSPIAPSEINPSIPKSLSDLISILLAKQPHQRYASAFGILQDLNDISAALQDAGDFPMKLHIAYNPGKIDFGTTLFGRDEILQKLNDYFARIEHFHSQIIFIEGFSGVGKTSLIQKFTKEVSSNKTILLEGKFDQYKQAPYAAIQMAFKDLEKQLLLKSNIDKEDLKRTLSRELGKNAGVLQEIIPSISVLVDTLEPVDILNPIETRNRFNFVFQKFCEVLSNLGLKIILFLDDWQWCDQPSLQLVKSLAQNSGKGMFFLFAYRGNEIANTHPFGIFKGEVEKLGYCNRIEIDALNKGLVNQMLATTLGMDESVAKELSALVFHKTEGNPFYIKQFVNSLHQKGLLHYDYQAHIWRWEKSTIEKEDLAENVLDLITQKIDTLSHEIQIIFKIASCMGGKFDLDLISEICGIDKTSIPIALDGTMESGYITKSISDTKMSYQFAHDRVQQAAYQLRIPDFQWSNTDLHYKIGTYLFKKGVTEDYPEGEILLHFLNAQELIQDDIAEQIIDGIVALNSNSGLSITPEASRQYFEMGLHLSAKYNIPKYRFRCFLGLSESHFLLNDLESAEVYAEKALESTDDILEKVELLRMKMLFYESYALFEKNIDTGLEALALFGIDAKEHFQSNTLGGLIEVEYALFNTLTKDGGHVNDLSNRKMAHPRELAIMDVLVNMNASAYFVNLYLFAWSTLKMTNQTLQQGFTNSTPFAFVFMGSLLVAFYQDFDHGYSFGKTGVDLLNKVDNDQYKSRTLSIFPIFIQHFKEPILNSTQNLDESIYSGLETGDLPYAGYSFYAKVRDAFLAGNDLNETLRLCNESISFMESVNNLGLLALMKLLKGSLLKLLGGYDAAFESVEKDALQLLLDVKFYTAVSHHYIFRSWAHCILKEYKSASELLKHNEEIVIFAASQPHVPKHYFLDSLCLLHQNQKLTKKLQQRIDHNQNVLLAWSKSMPENFSAEYYLVEMLLKARQGNIPEALALFNSAIKWANRGKLLGVEALAYDMAADLFSSSEYSILAKGFKENASFLYNQWNALAKMDASKTTRPQLLDTKHRGADLSTSSLIKAMQAISSEVNKADVIGKLLNTIMENAGADRCVLLLIEQKIPYVEAEIGSHSKKSSFERQPYTQQSFLPNNIIDYVINAKKEYTLDHEAALIQVDSDYIDKNEILSLLALPLIRQKELIGVLYLENCQFSGLFKGSDLEILKVIASQAAISIYNTLLFKETTDLNRALQASKDELSKMNLLLEEKIKDRTKVLRQEIEIRKQVEIELKKAQKAAEKFHQQQIKEERKEALQSKMMMLSSQMNPHFIFNSLGSVQSYILNNETGKAVDFISEFAGLMRKNLINSTTEYISIAEELEFLDKYLLLEKIRFNNSFEYKIKEKIDNIHDTLIPPMLLQPFIENAIIHGLSKLKERKGKLTLTLAEKNDRIVCTIEDNGIGRENALKHKKSTHKSVAISNLETRLELLNVTTENNEYTYDIIDLEDKNGPAGTRVIVSFPNDLH
ncbi:MAG: AAA family ATPase [Allomuricauda sp.]